MHFPFESSKKMDFVKYTHINIYCILHIKINQLYKVIILIFGYYESGYFFNSHFSSILFTFANFQRTPYVQG